MQTRHSKALVLVLLLTVVVVTGCRTPFKRPATPDGMALIPAGVFRFGNTTEEVEPIDLRANDTYVSAFYIAKHEVTWSLWRDVRDWALTNGYDFENMGKGQAGNHPVHSVCWFDCVKWCNALSQGEGKTPVYYTDASFTNVYTSGQMTPCVKWNADGYRLPTEAEWEKAARGGLAGLRFPWGETITHTNANYLSQINNWSYDVSPTKGLHPAFDRCRAATSPVGTFPPNGYGLFDMAGNVSEWCWDRYGGVTPCQTMIDPFQETHLVRNPSGPENGKWRIGRGGGWISNAHVCRTSDRNFFSPDYKYFDLGFRPVMHAHAR